MGEAAGWRSKRAQGQVSGRGGFGAVPEPVDDRHAAGALVVLRQPGVAVDDLVWVWPGSPGHDQTRASHFFAVTRVPAGLDSMANSSICRLDDGQATAPPLAAAEALHLRPLDVGYAGAFVQSLYQYARPVGAAEGAQAQLALAGVAQQVTGELAHRQGQLGHSHPVEAQRAGELCGSATRPLSVGFRMDGHPPNDHVSVATCARSP